MAQSGYSINGGINHFNDKLKGPRTNRTIGSIQNNKFNFPKNHKFFDNEVHMRNKAIKIVPLVKDEIDRDLLGLKFPKWNQSVSVPKSAGFITNER